MNAFLLVISSALGLLAGLIAFLITYDEYLHHFSERGTPLRYGLEAAVFAGGVFFLLTIIVEWVLTRMLS
jgi:hypothetical protein